MPSWSQLNRIIFYRWNNSAEQHSTTWKIARRIAIIVSADCRHHELIFPRRIYDMKRRKSMLGWLENCSPLSLCPRHLQPPQNAFRPIMSYIFQKKRKTKREHGWGISTSVCGKIYELNLRRELNLIKINKWTSCWSEKSSFFTVTDSQFYCRELWREQFFP